MLVPPIANGGTKNQLRTDGEDHSKDDRPEALVWVEQHRSGKTGNEAGRQEIQEISDASCKADRAVLCASIDPIQEHRNPDRREYRDNRCNRGLFKAKDSMPEHIPKNNQRREVPKSEQTQLGVFVRIEQKGGIERLRFQCNT